MKVENLKVGKLYGDRDGVDMLFFAGQYNEYLWRFKTAEYNEEEEDFKITDDERLLTKIEVKKLIEW